MLPTRSPEALRIRCFKPARSAADMERLPSYVLITPARNEAEFIERTLRSVAAQTTKPVRWVIVSHGSTDGTDGIVTRYVAQHPWIELVRMPKRGSGAFPERPRPSMRDTRVFEISTMT